MKEYKYKINGNEYNVAIIDLDGNKAAVEVNGVSYQVDILGDSVAAPVARPAAKPAPAPAPTATPAPAPAPAAAGKEVPAPMVGVVYLQANPDADPYVQVGDSVKKGQVLCLIEAMKLMNEIVAPQDGVVSAILVENENIVEYGQALFRIS